MKVTAVFDIGKTNKKLFLFDRNFQVVYQDATQFDETADDDGYPADDLPAITTWIRTRLQEVLQKKAFEVESLNFSTYGASWVHLDKTGVPLTPLYNYLRPYPEEILPAFYRQYGDIDTLAAETGSPFAGMLNAGFQLYWLKRTKPEVFSRIRFSLHFPQYLSYLFTGIPVSEYTSIGCHTSLWDYRKKGYHNWVISEELDRLLPPVEATGRTVCMPSPCRQGIQVGTGIHDSSAALLPYISSEQRPFLLLSTGTWNVCLNPFSQEFLTTTDIVQDTLQYMRTDGNPVRATRLFMGQEYALQMGKICRYFGKESEFDQKLRFEPSIYRLICEDPSPKFRFESLHVPRRQPAQTEYAGFANAETACHQLMAELVDLQADAILRAAGTTPVEALYIDGGFSVNDLFVRFISLKFPGLDIYTSENPLGSALGAALVISGESWDPVYLKSQCVV